MVTVEQLRRSRRRDVKTGGFTFTVELPTELRLYTLMGPDPKADAFIGTGALVKACVTNWKNVRECDLVPGAPEDELAFNREIFEEWIEDRPDLWDPIAETLFTMRRDRDATREADRKN